MYRPLLLACVLCVGCGPVVFIPDGTDKPSVVQPCTAQEIYSALGRSVERGRVQTLDELTRQVKRIKDNGDLSDGDFAKFADAFPGAGAKDRELDKSKDSATLKGIK